MSADEAYRVLDRTGTHLGTVSRTGERWEAFAGGNALHVPPPASSRVVATMAVLDNARRCGLLVGVLRGPGAITFEPIA